VGFFATKKPSHKEAQKEQKKSATERLCLKSNVFLDFFGTP
jgi:hypothetical protein